MLLLAPSTATDHSVDSVRVAAVQRQPDSAPSAVTMNNMAGSAGWDARPTMFLLLSTYNMPNITIRWAVQMFLVLSTYYTSTMTITGRYRGNQTAPRQQSP